MGLIVAALVMLAFVVLVVTGFPSASGGANIGSGPAGAVVVPSAQPPPVVPQPGGGVGGVRSSDQVIDAELVVSILHMKIEENGNAILQSLVGRSIALRFSQNSRGRGYRDWRTRGDPTLINSLWRSRQPLGIRKQLGNAEVYIVLALLIGFVTVVIGCWLSDNCWSPEPEHVVTLA